MDLSTREMIDSLPSKPHRSRLGPYAELITEMRTRGWTYRSIAKLLAEKFGLNVSPSNLHHFVKTLTQTGEGTYQQQLHYTELSTVRQAVLTKAEVDARIIALKRRAPDRSLTEKRFKFDPDEPLRLSKGRNADTSGDEQKA